MTTPPIPPALTRFTTDLLSNGWSFHVARSEDTGHAPFIRVQAIRKHDTERLSATWHTRETGGQRYRFHFAFHDGATVPSLSKLRAIATGETS